MSDNIRFFNQDGETIVTLSNLKLIEDTNHCSYNIDIFCKDAIVSITLFSEVYDFQYLISGLNKLYNKLIDSFEFSDIEKHLILKIKYTETGLIIFNFHIRNIDYSLKLNIDFTSDQTYIPFIIQEIKTSIGIK